MRDLPQYYAARALDAHLGDPFRDDSRFQFADALASDRAERYPEAHHAVLDDWGLPDYYIPAREGGRLASLDEVFALLRVLSRRDMTLAISHGITFLGAVPIWLAGTARQKRLVASLIKARHKIAFAITERDHGSDLLASEAVASRDDDGFLLSGQKWPIGNATRASALGIFARTDPTEGLRSFSLLFVDKRGLPPQACQHLPKTSTLGLRGADLSGVKFERCHLADEALVGTLGGGFEIVLKSLQITRAMCTALSLGAGDTALRLTVDFSLQRRLYNDTVFAIEHVRNTLANAFLDLLQCDCLAIGTVRALDVCPDQGSVWSSIAKALVPGSIENSIRDLSAVLGARFFLSDGHRWSMFQKLLRDNSIVSVFEGSTMVQLHALGAQLEQLLRAKKLDSDLSDRLEAIFSLDRALSPLDPAKLALFSRGANDALDGLSLAHEYLRESTDSVHVLAAVEAVLSQLDSLKAVAGRLYKMRSKSAELLDLCRTYANLHAAACCIHAWYYNRNNLDDFFARGDWLVLCVHRLCRLPTPHEALQPIAQEVRTRYECGQAFAIVPHDIFFAKAGDLP